MKTLGNVKEREREREKGGTCIYVIEDIRKMKPNSYISPVLKSTINQKIKKKFLFNVPDFMTYFY